MNALLIAVCVMVALALGVVIGFLVLDHVVLDIWRNGK